MNIDMMARGLSEKFNYFGLGTNLTIQKETCAVSKQYKMRTIL